MADTSHIRMPHLTALDGLRGVAVATVVTDHLITSLLLCERGMKGRLDLKGYFVRRLRSLAPAILAMLGIYALVAAQLAEAVNIQTHGLWLLA